MRIHSFTSLLSLLALAFVSGCPTERAPRPKEPVMREDAWSSLSPSNEWLHVTTDFEGDRRGECSHVLGWVTGEEGCEGSICRHGRDLADEWFARCSGLAAPEAVETVKKLKDKLAERAEQPASACGAELSAILQEGCRQDATCEVTGQRWATRCGKSAGSPLAVRLLARLIERKLPAPARVTLDTRPCDELRVEVVQAARCKDRASCTEVLGSVEAYRARCEGGDARPSLALAVAELAVMVGADKPSGPILVGQSATQLSPEDMPVVLSDGLGGVLLVCEQRASDLERYVAARKVCRDGRMVVARAFKGVKGVEVRVGSLDFPDEATFSARYPTIVAAKEVELRDRQEAVLFEGELVRAVDLGRSPAGAAEAARALVRAVNAHAVALSRSAAVRVTLSSRDEALAPALAELGKAKALATRGQGTAIEIAGLLGRAPSRAFADVTAEGVVEVGVATRAGRLDTAAMLPKATVRYRQALRQARSRKIDDEIVKVAKAEGTAAAARCGAAEKRMQDAKLGLMSCSFEVERCDNAKFEALVKTIDEARGAAEVAYNALDLARTGAAAGEAFAITRAAETAGCREPWW